MNDPKTTLRQSLRLSRQQLSRDQVVVRSSAIVRHVVTARFYQRARRIGLYQPIDNEVDPSLLLLDAACSGKEIFLPIADKRTRSLRFVPYHSGEPLRQGSFGILEPVPSTLDPGLPDPGQLDLIFQPLVGFDRSGGRLGFGGGYYDRALSRHGGRDFSGTQLVGLAYAFQEVPVVPRQPHDVPMGWVVTEAGVHLCANPHPC
ncbi:MAG: 5-formyltetrahydrofolate cyclo-ligase [Magnetococcales bacterium]|nr:5-formyltetrahydrofolate cyclo-ligase [Magnetococcales bacterium]